MQEVWIEIPSFSGYDVSNSGQVRSWIYRGPRFPRPSEPRLLKPSLDKDGYRSVVLMTNGIRNTRRVATLVALAFIGPRPEGYQVCHRDNVRQNDCVDNLRYDTGHGNQADRIEAGTSTRGGGNGRAKLEESAVLIIRDSSSSRPALAKRYGVSTATIRDIQFGRTWKHVI